MTKLVEYFDPTPNQRNKVRRLLRALESGRFGINQMEELVELARELGKVAGVGRVPVSVAEQAAHRAQLQQVKKAALQEGIAKGYEKFAEQMLVKSAAIQSGVLDTVLNQATFQDAVTGEVGFDFSRCDQRQLQMALTVSKELVDRVKGKATQRFETKSEHSLLFKLHQQGELD